MIIFIVSHPPDTWNAQRFICCIEPSHDYCLSYVLINPSTAKLCRPTWNFHPLEVVSRWRDPQLQASENYSDLTKWRSTLFKSCWLMSHFISNIYKKVVIIVLITNENPNICGTGGWRVEGQKWVACLISKVLASYHWTGIYPTLSLYRNDFLGLVQY